MVKKIVFVAFLTIIASSVKAQWYVAGRFGFGAGTEGTSYMILPELGYELNDKWEIGVEAGYMKASDASTWMASPYACWTFYQLGKCSLYLCGTAEFSEKMKHHFTFGLYVTPGISIPLGKHWELEAEVNNVLGLTTSKNYNQFGITTNTTGLTLGVEYHF